MVKGKSVILMHYKARAHSAKQTQEIITSLGRGIFLNLPYSSDVAVTDFHFFRLLEHFVNDRTFKNEKKNLSK